MNLSLGRIVSGYVCVLLGAQVSGQAQPLVHQISLPAGVTWCSDTMIRDLLTQVNAFRVSKGVAALQMDTLGMKVAETRALQFANYMATHSPGSPGFNPHEGWNTTASALGYNIISENLAFMTSNPTYIVYSTWQDPTHIAAMVASDANVAGVSCVVSNGVPYWTYEPGKTATSSAAPAASTDETAVFLTLINEYRAQNGLNPLRISPTLTAAATWMSNDMATKNYASHTDSLGRSPGARIAAFGYTYLPYGENIAGGSGDAANALNQWKTACDPDAAGACTYAHRRAMLNPSFAAIGIGRSYNASSTYRWYWVTDFGGYVDSGSPAPTPTPTPAPVPVISFAATPASVVAGQTSTLSWSVAGATTISIDNGVGTVSGLTSKTVTPLATTTYRLTAINSNGSSTAAVTVTVSRPAADTQPPSAPSLTSVTAKSETRVDLVWRASTDNIGVSGYQILRNGSPAGSVSATVLAFTDAVAPGTTYTYTVRAFDAAGNYSSASNAVPVTTPVSQSAACPAPASGAFTGCYYNNVDLSGAPALVRTDSRIDFDWGYTRPAPAIPGPSWSARWQGNFVFTAGTHTFSLMASDGVRLYIDGNLVLDRWRDQPVYFFTVRPTLSAGTHRITLEYYQRTGTPKAYLAWLNNSPVSSAPVISSFIANPASITAGQSTTLSWSASGASTVTIDNGPGNLSTRNSIVVTPATTTTYRLTASNNAGTAAASVTVSVGSTADTQVPTAPVMRSATAAGATQVNVAWTASTDNKGVATYRIFRNGGLTGSVAGSALAYVDSAAAAGTTYTYTVRAVDAAGNTSASSNAISVTTPAAAAPNGCTPATNAFTGCYYNNIQLTGTPVLIRTDNQINFDWTFTSPDRSVPATNYSTRWQGNFTFEEGLYTFNASASDGMRIYIDGTLILDRWRDQPVYSYVIRRALTAGIHLITVEYYERTGTATARLSWQKD